MPANLASVGQSDLALARSIFGLVGHIPIKPHEMAWLATRSREHVNDIFERLLDLGYEIVALELRLCVPADLTSNKNLPALRCDAIGVAPWRGQSFGCTISNALLLMVLALLT